MRRFLILLTLGLGLGLWLGAYVAPEGPAEAVTASQVVGIYQLRLKGEGFHRGNDDTYRNGRVRGLAEMRILDTDVDRNDGEFEVEIRLHRSFDDTFFDKLTPPTAFKGRGVLVGDTLTVIGTAVPNFVNVVYMRFMRAGRKVTGTWMVSYPAKVDATSAFAGGAGVAFVGKHVRNRGQVPGDAEFSFSRTDSLQAR